MSALGRLAPTDRIHEDRYPLRVSLVTKPTPVVLGINWYRSMSNPVLDTGTGRWWIKDISGPLDGGHAICVKPGVLTDPLGWWDFYNQGNVGACFQRGTLIRMGDGTNRPIEDIKPLDVVVSAEGRPRRVLGTMARFHEEGLIRLSLVGHRHLRCTPEHPILTSRGYVPAREVALGDEVCLTRYLPTPITSIDVAEHLSERALRERTAMRRVGGVATVISAPPRTIALTPAFGRLVGLFLAEGGTTPHKIVWTFGGHEKDTLVAETVDLIRETLGAEARVQVRPSGAVNVTLHGKAWRMLFESLFVLGAYEKRLGVANGPRAYLEAVLDGWLAGDGYERRSTRQGVTVSHQLALDMYALAQGLGLRPTIRHSKPPGKRERWDIEIATGGRSTRSRQDDHAVWRKVVGLEAEEFAGFVHNLHVEDDESYVAEGIGVHNCVGFSCSRMMSLMNRVRYSAFWLYYEAQKIDEWAGESYEGTSVRAGLDILRLRGHSRTRLGTTLPEELVQGISANRWTTSVADIHETIKMPLADSLDGVPLLNSWGRFDYPHITWLKDDDLDRLLREDGECAVVTDR